MVHSIWCEWLKMTQTLSVSYGFHVFLGSQGIPFVVAGYNNHDNLKMLVELDKICNSYLSNHVAKRASTRQVCVYLYMCMIYMLYHVISYVISYVIVCYIICYIMLYHMLYHMQHELYCVWIATFSWTDPVIIGVFVVHSKIISWHNCRGWHFMASFANGLS